jgi:uncharacterized protein with NAD-binding domain and iron-sulfur cluster
LTTPHVLIAGGGLSGLCLAQGLVSAGVSCAVYQRDTDRAAAPATASPSTVYPIMEMSADHDRFGGGGLRREEPA